MVAKQKKKDQKKSDWYKWEYLHSNCPFKIILTERGEGRRWKEKKDAN